MILSPLQLRQQYFVDVLVESGVGPQTEQFNFPEQTAPVFDYEGIKFEVNLSIAVNEEQQDNPTEYLVDLRFAIPEGCPYKIDIRTVGLFSINADLPIHERDNIVTVNGAAVLYGAIRELVTTITSRSLKGLLTLPTVNFSDHRRPAPEQQPQVKQ